MRICLVLGLQIGLCLFKMARPIKLNVSDDNIKKLISEADFNVFPSACTFFGKFSNY